MRTERDRSTPEADGLHRDDVETPTPSHETDKERVDRELIELLNELRVILPGVQVLFAFLLTVPFTQAFESLDASDRVLYFGVFILTAFATGLLMTPSSYHRIRFREGDKERMLRTSNASTIAGIVLLALAITGSVLLVGDVVFGAPTAATAAVATGVFLFGVWFALPLLRRTREGT